MKTKKQKLESKFFFKIEFKIFYFLKKFFFFLENFLEDDLPEIYFPIRRLCVSLKKYLEEKEIETQTFQERLTKKWNSILFKNCEEEEILSLLMKNMKHFKKICYLSLLEFEKNCNALSEKDIVEIFSKHYEGGEKQIKKDHKYLIHEYKTGKIIKIIN